MIKNWIWDLPATTAVWSNNQIGKYIDRKWATILKDVFSATANWFWKVFFQPNEFTVLQDSYAFTFKKPVKNIKRLQMYFISVLNKIYSKYSWENKSWWNKIKEEVITLPILSNWELAYEYMENYIKEIEAYLQSTGLSDYELNKDEKLALQNILSSNSKKFRLDKLFEKIERWQRLKKDDQIDGKIPFVTAWFNNTWITNYISNPIAFFPWNSITIDMFWNVFYRDYDFWADDNISVYYDENKQKSKLINLYLTSILSKRIKGTFSYGKQFRCSKNMDLEITLPITSNNEINYPLIETYIKATQKLVIKDLVDNINEKLKTYKQVI